MSQSAVLAEKEPRKIPIKVFIVLIIGTLSISFAPILGRLAQGESVSSIVIAASRLIIATVVLTPIVLQRYRSHIRQLSIRDLSLAIAAGVALAVHFTAWFTSLEYTSVLVSTVFVTSSPLWVALFEFIFLKAKLPRLVVIGLLVAVAGGMLIGFAGQADLETPKSTTTIVEETNIEADTAIVEEQPNEIIGWGLALLGAIVVSIYLIIGRSLQQSQKLPIIPYIWLVYGSAAITLSIVLLIAGIPLTGYTTNAYIWLLAMGIFPQLLGHSSLNYAMGYLPATLVSMTTQLEPIGSAIIAYIIFAELPLPLQIVGSGIILVGVLLANIGQLKKPKQGKNA